MSGEEKKPRRVYPIARPEESDPRFTVGFVSDVAKVLAAHNFPFITHGEDHLRLTEALFDFLYRKESDR